MEYLKAFLVGGAICMVGQILIDKTKLTPARILVCFVVLGVILGGLMLAAPLAGLIVGVIWIGVGALVYGLLQIFAAFKVRKLAS